MKTYPVYILELDRNIIRFPQGKVDISHVDFWEKEIAEIVAQHYGFSVSLILNAPYCQLRGRVSGKTFFFCGESLTDTIMKDIKFTLNEPLLRLVYDEHHQRLPYDVAILKAAIAQGRLK